MEYAVLNALRYRTLVPAGLVPDFVPVLKQHYPGVFKSKRYPKTVYQNKSFEEHDRKMIESARIAIMATPVFSDIKETSPSELRTCNAWGRSSNILIDIIPGTKWEYEASLVKLLSLAAMSETEITNIMWVFPMFDLSVVGLSLVGWNRDPFNQELSRLSSHIASLSLAKMREPAALPFHLMGRTINRDKPIGQLIRDWSDSGTVAPFQVFLGSPISNLGLDYTAEEIDGADYSSKSTNVHWYSHAAYTIKLAQPTEACRRMLRSELETAKAMGARGVVLHTGERSDSAILANSQIGVTCYDQMVKNVRVALQYATPECPLLIETPAGEKNEMLPFIQELAGFMNSFTPEESSNLGLCVDTCHVFAAGYHPVEYLKTWSTLSNIPIKLVHYNDSEKGVGCHIDRHATPGLGSIGITVMVEVAVWCANNKVDFVRE